MTNESCYLGEGVGFLAGIEELVFERHRFGNRRIDRLWCNKVLKLTISKLIACTVD